MGYPCRLKPALHNGGTPALRGVSPYALQPHPLLLPLARVVTRVINFFKRHWAALMSSSFARNVAIAAGGTGFAQVLSLISAPILTRLYEPGDYGVLAAFASVCGIFIALSSLRYQVAIPIPESDEDGANLLVLSLVIVVGVAIAGTTGVYALRDEICTWTECPELAAYLWMIPIAVLGGGFYEVLAYWAIRREAFKMLAKTKISRSLGGVIPQIILGFFKQGTLGLLIGNLLGQLSGNSAIALMAWRKDRGLLKAVSLKRMLAMAGRFKKFPLFNAPSELLVVLPALGPSLLVVTFYGAHEAGLFDLAVRVFRRPTGFIVSSVLQVFMHRASLYAREAPQRLPRLFFATAGRLFAFALIPAALLAIFGPQIVGFVFGEQWTDAGIYLRLIAPILLAQVTVQSVSPVLLVLNLPEWQLGADILRTGASIGAIFLAHYLWNDPHLTILTYTIALVSVYAMHFGLYTYAVLKKLPVVEV